MKKLVTISLLLALGCTHIAHASWWKEDRETSNFKQQSKQHEATLAQRVNQYAQAFKNGTLSKTPNTLAVKRSILANTVATVTAVALSVLQRSYRPVKVIAAAAFATRTVERTFHIDVAKQLDKKLEAAVTSTQAARNKATAICDAIVYPSIFSNHPWQKATLLVLLERSEYFDRWAKQIGQA